MRGFLSVFCLRLLKEVSAELAPAVPDFENKAFYNLPFSYLQLGCQSINLWTLWLGRNQAILSKGLDAGEPGTLTWFHEFLQFQAISLRVTEYLESKSKSWPPRQGALPSWANLPKSWIFLRGQAENRLADWVLSPDVSKIMSLWFTKMAYF